MQVSAPRDALEERLGDAYHRECPTIVADNLGVGSAKHGNLETPCHEAEEDLGSVEDQLESGDALGVELEILPHCGSLQDVDLGMRCSKQLVGSELAGLWITMQAKTKPGRAGGMDMHNKAARRGR